MEDDFRLQELRVAIVGLGLMGGSLALALKGKCAVLYGVDSDHATLEMALSRGIVEQADTNPAKLLPQADLIVLATPVPVIMDLLQALPEMVKEDCVLIDLGSTKTDIVRVMADLPQNFDPIGGHPICGKENLGLENAEGNLFQNTSFVITPLTRTTLRAREAVKQIIAGIGARLIEMNAEEHDRALASTSHLPFLLSSALALSTPQEFAPFVGTGFKSTSRLAGTPPHMTMGILHSNRENILHAIQMFRGSLDQIESVLQNENYTELEQILSQSRFAYRSFIYNH